MKVTNKYYNHQELKTRINLENACYHSVQDVILLSPI